MKLITKSLTALAIAISLAACSDDKNEKPTSDNQAAVKTADSKAVTNKANNKEQPAQDESFKQMLTHIPADTAYLVTNKKTFPKDMLEFHLKRGQQAYAMLESFLDQASEKSTTTDDSSKTQEDTKANDNLMKFGKALLADIRDNMSVDKLANTGIKVDGHNALYAIDLTPVLRYDIVSKKSVMDTIKRAEKTSGYKVEWKKCGQYQCIEQDSKDGESGIAIAIQENQVVASFFAIEKKTAIMAHLTGESKPEKSFNESKWSAFLADNKYQGYGDGFVDLQKTFKILEDLILVQTKKEAEGQPYDEKEIKACLAVAKLHFDNIPEAVFGITALEKKTMNYEIALKTSPVISAALQAIPNQLTGMQKAEKPVFDFGLNINIGKLREGLTQYTNFLVKAAGEAKCDAVKPAAIRKAMGSFAMATMMGADQFKALYVSLNDFKMSADGKPEKIDALASVAADDPGALLQMLAMANPAFATLTLPKDGSAMKLPEGLIPPNPTGINPDLFLSQKDQLLTLMVGNDKPAVKPFTTTRPAFLWSTIDSKRYYNLLGNVMDKMPQDKGAIQGEQEKTKKTIEMLSKMSEISSVIYTEMGADDRGISINYSVEYQ